MALKEEEANAGYVKPTDIETVMRILADHGYDAANWQPLSSDYKYLWDKELNQMILILKEDGSIVYPDAEGYLDKGISAVSYGAGLRFQEYNQNVIAAFSNNFSFGSSANTNTEQVKITGSTSSTSAGQAVLSSAVGGGTTGTQANSQLKTALGISGNTVYVAASSVAKSSTSSSFASCESLYVTEDETLVITADLLSTGKYAPNLYVVSVTYGPNATPEEKLIAEKAGGEYIYSLFVQMNTGAISNDSNIVIPAGTKINCSEHEWKSVKSITGYFGSEDPNNPAIIDGLKLTSDTGYAQTYTLKGSGSQYYITGFIGAVYGTATVENLTFKNLTINSPGKDYQVASDKANRNTVAIIGGIIPDPKTGTTSGAVDVNIKNIVVEESCTIDGIASVGGIVGYIGAEEGFEHVTGSVNIENCSFAGTVISQDSRYISDGYSPVGGIIGFTCRCTSNLTVTVDNCTFSGNASGYGAVGGVIGNMMNGKLVVKNSTVTGTTSNLGNCTYPYKKDGKTLTNYANYGKLGIICGAINADNLITVDEATITNNSLTKSNAQGSNVKIVGLAD